MKKHQLLLLAICLSLHSSAQWQMTSGPHLSGTTSSLAVKDTCIYAGTEHGGIFLSTDHGTTWMARNTGLTNLNNVMAIAIDEMNVFAGVHNSLSGPAVFRSTDHAAHWAPTPLQFLFMFSLIVNPQIMVAGTWNGVSVSIDGGASWQDYTAGLPSNASVFSLAFCGTKIFAGINASSVGGTGVFSSVTYGTSWTSYNTGFPASTVVNALVVTDADMYAGTPDGVYKSGVVTANWSPVNNGLANTSIHTFYALGNNLVAGTDNGMFLTSDGGVTWVDASAGLPANTKIYCLVADSSFLYAGTDSVVWKRPLSEVAGIYENTTGHVDFNMYPNPATKDFLVTVGSGMPAGKEKYELNMTDIAGKKILHRMIPGENATVVDVSLFPAGVYFITVTDRDKRSLTKKMMKM